MKLEEATMPAIRDWLKANPDKAQAVLNSNPSYVFFTLREPDNAGPVGALNVPLQPERSIAVDPNFIPLGSPVWFDTSLPDASERPTGGWCSRRTPAAPSAARCAPTCSSVLAKTPSASRARCASAENCTCCCRHRVL
jgi:hypothetical protein